MFHWTEREFAHHEAFSRFLKGEPLEPPIFDALASALSSAAAQRSAL